MSETKCINKSRYTYHYFHSIIIGRGVAGSLRGGHTPRAPEGRKGRNQETRTFGPPAGSQGPEGLYFLMYIFTNHQF